MASNCSSSPPSLGYGIVRRVIANGISMKSIPDEWVHGAKNAEDIQSLSFRFGVQRCSQSGIICLLKFQGTYLIVYRLRFATIMYNSIIMQSFLIWATSLFMGGSSARWLYKGGLLQCIVLLIPRNYYRVGYSYLALVWLVAPAFAYGLLEATLSPVRLPKPLKTVTLLIGLSFPFPLSSGTIVRLTATLIGYTVRIERNPGGNPEWVANFVVANYIAAVVCLSLVYLPSYIHIPGAKSVVFASSTLFGIAIAAVVGGFIPAFTEEASRTVNQTSNVANNICTSRCPYYAGRSLECISKMQIRSFFYCTFIASSLWRSICFY